MWTVKCERFAQRKAFKAETPEDQSGWYAWVDQVKAEVPYESGCRDLFYGLLQEGIARTVSESRAQYVVKTLISKFGIAVDDIQINGR